MVIENMSSYTVPLKCIVDTNWIHYSLSYNNKSSTLIEYLIKKLGWCLVGGYNYKYASRCCFETFSIHVITKRSIYVVEQIYDLLTVQPLPKCRHHHSCLNNSWWYFYSASVYLAWNPNYNCIWANKYWKSRNTTLHGYIEIAPHILNNHGVYWLNFFGCNGSVYLLVTLLKSL